MPRKSKRSNKRSIKGKKTRKQKIYVMRGCSNKTKSCKHKHNKVFSSLGAQSCPYCGPNCHCGPNCNCSHPCPGNCYLNNKKIKGGSGCGSCGCPIAPLSTKAMNQFVGGTSSSPLDYKPILGIGQNGGTCSTCLQLGGNFFKPASSIPGPEVGSAWGTSINKWPGVNGVQGDRNFLDNYDLTKDPQLQMSMNDAGYKNLNSITGGYKYINRNRNKSSSISKKSMKAGGLIPQDLVNLGSDFSFNLKSAYNALNGYKGPVNPLPYKDQLSHSFTNNRNIV